MEGVNSCEDVCINSHGSYHCSSPEGFQLADDGYSCQGNAFTFEYMQLSGRLSMKFDSCSSSNVIIFHGERQRANIFNTIDGTLKRAEKVS